MRVLTTRFAMAALLAAALIATTGTANATLINVAASANGGTASHINSVPDVFAIGGGNGIPGGANDSNGFTVNHTDYDGRYGGYTAVPDALRIDFLAASNNLVDITVVNHNETVPVGSPSLFNIQRLVDATVQAFDASDTQIGATETIPAIPDTTLANNTFVFTNAGAGYANASYIVLTMQHPHATDSGFPHVAEFEAHVIPEPCSFALVCLACLGFVAVRRRR